MKRIFLIITLTAEGLIATSAMKFNILAVLPALIGNVCLLMMARKNAEFAE